MTKRSAWIGVAVGACAAVAATVVVLLAPSGGVLAFAGSDGDGPISGAWTIEPTNWKQETAGGPAVQLTLQMRSPNGRGHWNNSSPIALSELRGLSAGQMEGDGPVQFQVVRDAGTLSLDGSFRKGTGA